MTTHNQYCRDDWMLYHGDGPRGMGPNNDGCVCELAPEDYRIPLTPEQLIAQSMEYNAQLDKGDALMGTHPSGEPMYIDEAVLQTRTTDPRLWDVEPNGVTHIAGGQINLFGRYLRQRCEWCGVILLEYDLERVAVPEGQEGGPTMWTPGVLVRVDGHVSAEIDNPLRTDEGVQLPPDSCAFNPLTQVGL